MQCLQAAVDRLELGETADQARLAGTGPLRVVHRPEAGHPGESGRAGGYAFDRLGPEADLFDIHTWRKIFRHLEVPFRDAPVEATAKARG
jgi:hypothetical protein